MRREMNSCRRCGNRRKLAGVAGERLASRFDLDAAGLPDEVVQDWSDVPRLAPDASDDVGVGPDEPRRDAPGVGASGAPLTRSATGEIVPEVRRRLAGQRWRHQEPLLD